MKAMKSSFAFVSALFLFALAGLRAESVIAVPDSTTLAPAGGDVTLTITLDYGEAPAAMGLSLKLPDGWAFGGVIAGPNPPQISSEIGATQTAELAWMQAPANGAEFAIKLSYPAGATAETLSGTAQLRRDGKRLDLALTVPLGE